MRRAFALLVVVAVVGASVVAGNSVNTETVEMTPIPRPADYAADMDKPVPFDSSTVVTVDCPDMDAVRWLDAHFANALRLVGRDMKVADRENTGLVNHQTPESWTEGH